MWGDEVDLIENLTIEAYWKEDEITRNENMCTSTQKMFTSKTAFVYEDEEHRRLFRPRLQKTLDLNDTENWNMHQMEDSIGVDFYILPTLREAEDIDKAPFPEAGDVVHLHLKNVKRVGKRDVTENDETRNSHISGVLQNIGVGIARPARDNRIHGIKREIEGSNFGYCEITNITTHPFQQVDVSLLYPTLDPLHKSIKFGPAI